MSSPDAFAYVTRRPARRPTGGRTDPPTPDAPFTAPPVARIPPDASKNFLRARKSGGGGEGRGGGERKEERGERRGGKREGERNEVAAGLTAAAKRRRRARSRDGRRVTKQASGERRELEIEQRRNGRRHVCHKRPHAKFELRRSHRRRVIRRRRALGGLRQKSRDGVGRASGAAMDKPVFGQARYTFQRLACKV